jgi:hypothetical protein
MFTKAMSCYVLCAWVLWSQSYLDKQKATLEVINAYDTSNECRTGLADLIAGNKERGKKVEPGIIYWNERQYATLICLPDTVKPN